MCMADNQAVPAALTASKPGRRKKGCLAAFHDGLITESDLCVPCAKRMVGEPGKKGCTAARWCDYKQGDRDESTHADIDFNTAKRIRLEREVSLRPQRPHVARIRSPVTTRVRTGMPDVCLLIPPHPIEFTCRRVQGVPTATTTIPRKRQPPDFYISEETLRHRSTGRRRREPWSCYESRIMMPDADRVRLSEHVESFPDGPAKNEGHLLISLLQASFPAMCRPSPPTFPNPSNHENVMQRSEQYPANTNTSTPDLPKDSGTSARTIVSDSEDTDVVLPNSLQVVDSLVQAAMQEMVTRLRANATTIAQLQDQVRYHGLFAC